MIELNFVSQMSLSGGASIVTMWLGFNFFDANNHACKQLYLATLNCETCFDNSFYIVHFDEVKYIQYKPREKVLVTVTNNGVTIQKISLLRSLKG